MPGIINHHEDLAFSLEFMLSVNIALLKRKAKGLAYVLEVNDYVETNLEKAMKQTTENYTNS